MLFSESRIPLLDTLKLTSPVRTVWLSLRVSGKNDRAFIVSLKVSVMEPRSKSNVNSINIGLLVSGTNTSACLPSYKEIGISGLPFISRSVPASIDRYKLSIDVAMSVYLFSSFTSSIDRYILMKGALQLSEKPPVSV